MSKKQLAKKQVIAIYKLAKKINFFDLTEMYGVLA